VFVPTWKQACLTALDLVTYATVSGVEKSTFLRCTPKDLAPYLADVKDEDLKHALSQGIGYLHESLTASEQKVVTDLFIAEAIHVRTCPICKYFVL